MEPALPVENETIFSNKNLSVMYIQVEQNSDDETVILLYTDNGNLLVAKSVSESVEDLRRGYREEGLFEQKMGNGSFVFTENPSKP